MSKVIGSIGSMFGNRTRVLLSVAIAFFLALMLIGCYVGSFEKSTSGDTPSVSTFTDNRDGKSYKKVTIGEQTWMAENLNYAVEGSKCYANNSDFCARYGRLYDWNMAKESCPVGWHLPSDDEWTTLINYVGTTVGKKFKSRSGWHERSGNGTDEYGFSALPGGLGAADNSDDFIGAGYASSWWSATESNAYDAWARSIIETVDREDDVKTALFYVRCLQDANAGQTIESKDGDNVASSTDTGDDSGDGGDSNTTFTDDRDEKTYKKVTIGEQTWMAENLNYATTEGSKCYGNSEDNCVKYGRLYSWKAALGACPDGWHLPSGGEWEALENTVGGSSTAGMKLKSKTGWNENGNGTDNYKFSALPGGLFGDGSDDFLGTAGEVGEFGDIGFYAMWWTASPSRDGFNAWYRGMNSNYNGVGKDASGRKNLYSVRCVQND